MSKIKIFQYVIGMIDLAIYLQKWKANKSKELCY